MKNNFNKTEDLLQNGKTISLSVSEHNEMKSSLLSYAEFHGVKKQSTKNLFVLSGVWVRSVASASLALILFIGTGYASTSSLPGEFLYPVKTNVIEELAAATKLTPVSQLEYHHERYETRLLELHTLSEMGLLTAAALGDSQGELTKLSLEIKELMDTDNNIDDVIALELVSDIVSMGNATEAVVRGNGTEEQLDAFEGITDEMEQVHDAEITDMLKNSTSTVEIYVQDQLSEISKELAENDLEEITTVRVADYMEGADASLQDEDYSSVVNQLAEAITLIKTKEYTNDFNDEVLE